MANSPSKQQIKEGLKESAKAVEKFRSARKADLDDFLDTMGERIARITSLRDEAIAAKLKHSETASDRNQSYLSSIIYSNKFGSKASATEGNNGDGKESEGEVKGPIAPNLRKEGEEHVPEEKGEPLPPAASSGSAGDAAPEKATAAEGGEETAAAQLNEGAKQASSIQMVPPPPPLGAEVQPLGTFDASVVKNFPNNETLVFHYTQLQNEGFVVSGHLTNIRIYITLNLPAVSEWNSEGVTKMMQVIQEVEEANEKEVLMYDTALLKYLSHRREIEQRAYDLPLASVAQFIASMESDAWDQLEILFRSFIDTLLQIHSTLTEVRKDLDGSQFKKAGASHLYA